MKKLFIVALVTIVACALFGPIGLISLFGSLLSFETPEPTLGVYPSAATTDLAGYLSQNPQVKQALWIDRVLDTNGASYQECPFADAMVGKVMVGQSASHSQLNKAVVEITDTRKVRGDTINIFSTAGVGGEGATGDNVRLGTEAQIVTGNMTVTIGNQLFAVGYKQSSVDKSMIGKEVYDQEWLNDDLRKLHAKRKNDTIIWRMMQAAGYGQSAFTGAPATNLLYPEGVASRDSLKSTDTVDLPLIMYSGSYLPGLGAMPMDTVQDSGGSVGELFMFLSTDKALVDLESDPTLTQVLQYGWDRGQNNPIFGGGFVKVRGHGLYRWIQRDHANYDNIGSPLLARAKLGVALTGANTGDIIRGGGLLYRTDTVPQWFKHFGNAPVVMYGGVNNVAATTATTRYLMIINPTGSYAVYSYTVNTGNAITIGARVAIGVGTESNTHPQGALIVECNVLGTTIGRSLMFGAQAVVGGIGSINQTAAGPESGRVVKQLNDLENDVSIGVEGCAGYSAVQRAGDSAYPGFVVIETAVHVPGAPVIS